jgi:transposase
MEKAHTGLNLQPEHFDAIVKHLNEALAVHGVSPEDMNAVSDRVLTLSKIGSMPVVMHRPLPEGFALKTATIVKKADGWYLAISVTSSTPNPNGYGRGFPNSRLRVAAS